MGDCFGDEGDLISYYLHEYLERKKTLFTFSLERSLDCCIYLVVYKENDFILKCSDKRTPRPLLVLWHSIIQLFIHTQADFVPMVNFFFHLLS